MSVETLDQARERLRPHVERASRFSGWSDFPAARLLGPDLPWDYKARARDLLQACTRVLDIGTGGGENFEDVIAGSAVQAVATEEWLTNVPLASQRLRRYGVQVIHASDEHLPFASTSFDLVLNRHSGFDGGDVARLLLPGGVMLTQQVEGDNWRELRPFFPRKPLGDSLALDCDRLTGAGLTIRYAKEHLRQVAYADLGEMVYMLCVTPWTIPDFDPLGADLEALLAFERSQLTANGIEVSEGRYIIEAQKQSAG